ncbi:hypothetical protein B0H13DRAFT_2668465, partial [Mycena leptocephala]
MGSVPASPHAAPAHTTGSSSSGESTGAKEARAPRARAVPVQKKKSKGRLKLDDTTKTRSEPGRAKQTHAPCVSNIPIPPSSRFSCRPFPHMQRSPAAADKKRNGERPATHLPSKSKPAALALALALATLTSYSAHHCLLLPLACSFLLPLSIPSSYRLPILHTPRLPRAYSQGEQSSSRARARIHLPIVSVKLSYFIAAAGGPVAGMRAFGTLVLPARRTSILGSTPQGGAAILRSRLHFYLPIVPRSSYGPNDSHRSSDTPPGTSAVVRQYGGSWALVEGLRSTVGAHGAKNSDRAPLALPPPFPNRLLPRARSRDEDVH